MNALELVQQGIDRYWLAELHRLHGELLWAGGADGRIVEAVFQQALQAARSQEALMLELRAAMSLARLWQEQDKRQAARQVLAKVYDRFTEGFGEEDFKGAGALLRELS
jgi:predicted ATPase